MSHDKMQRQFSIPHQLYVTDSCDQDQKTKEGKVQAYSPGVRYLFPWPLEVGGENEADVRIRILVDDSLRLLFVLQHIIDPVQGELLRLQEVSGLVF